MSLTNDHSRNALERIATQSLAAVQTLMRRIWKPFGEEPARAVLSLTGFSGVWEQDVTNSYQAEPRH
jgi:hypothetical protein